ncbi:hypothetical protein [Escherichia fergusonii]|nr:hypothetical protein [Escherichia fergusonii]
MILTIDAGLIKATMAEEYLVKEWGVYGNNSRNSIGYKKKEINNW